MIPIQTRNVTKGHRTHDHYYYLWPLGSVAMTSVCKKITCFIFIEENNYSSSINTITLKYVTK